MTIAFPRTIPLDIWRQIFKIMPPFQLYKCSSVCIYWKEIIYSSDQLSAERKILHEGFKWIENAKKVAYTVAFMDFPHDYYQKRDYEAITSIAKVEALIDPIRAIDTIKSFLRAPSNFPYLCPEKPLNSFARGNDTSSFYLALIQIIKLAAQEFFQDCQALASNLPDKFKQRALSIILKQNLSTVPTLLTFLGDKSGIPLLSYYWIKTTIVCFPILFNLNPTEAENRLFNVKDALNARIKSAEIRYKGYMILTQFEKTRGNESEARENFKKAYEILDAFKPGPSTQLKSAQEKYLLQAKFLLKGIQINRKIVEEYLTSLKQHICQSKDQMTRYKILTKLAKIEVALDKNTPHHTALTIGQSSVFTPETARSLAKVAKVQAKKQPQEARAILLFMKQESRGKQDLLFAGLIDIAHALIEIAQSIIHLYPSEDSLIQAGEDLTQAKEKILMYIQGTRNYLNKAIGLLLKIAQLQFQHGLKDEARITLQLAKENTVGLKENGNEYFQILLKTYLVQTEILPTDVQETKLALAELTAQAQNNISYSLMLVQAFFKLPPYLIS